MICITKTAKIPIVPNTHRTSPDFRSFSAFSLSAQESIGSGRRMTNHKSSVLSFIHLLVPPSNVSHLYITQYSQICNTIFSFFTEYYKKQRPLFTSGRYSQGGVLITLRKIIMQNRVGIRIKARLKPLPPPCVSILSNHFNTLCKLNSNL